jgi:hypothetical protein
MVRRVQHEIEWERFECPLLEPTTAKQRQTVKTVHLDYEEDLCDSERM